MNPQDETVHLIRRALAAGIMQYTIANTLGITTRTLRRWREGGCVPRLDAYRKLVSLVELMERRQQMITKIDEKLGITDLRAPNGAVDDEPARPLPGRRSAKHNDRAHGRKKRRKAS